jgi:hypothetical protein
MSATNPNLDVLVAKSEKNTVPGGRQEERVDL